LKLILSNQPGNSQNRVPSERAFRMLLFSLVGLPLSLLGPWPQGSLDLLHAF